MRIIGGRAKGRRLKAPKGQALRPTSARVKEALFNILPHDLSGWRILDLFAGTGNVSLEALSRGAAEALLVDASRSASRAIQENLRSLGFIAKSGVWTAPVLRSLRVLARQRRKFDLIFLDPPYEKDLVRSVMGILAETEILAESGVIVVEHSIRESVEQTYGNVALRDQRRYGTTLLSFFVHRSRDNRIEDR
jgi:16S rRNA (guanine(966)-N(2))-methyltransferase RsmD